MGKACSCKRNCRRSLEVTNKKADTFRSVGFLSAINQSLRFELNLYDIRLRTRKIKIAPIEYIIINVKSTSFPKRLRLVANAFSASAANIPWSAPASEVEMSLMHGLTSTFLIIAAMCEPGIRFTNVRKLADGNVCADYKTDCNRNKCVECGIG